MSAMGRDWAYTNASKQQACHGVLDRNVSMRRSNHLALCRRLTSSPMIARKWRSLYADGGAAMTDRHSMMTGFVKEQMIRSRGHESTLSKTARRRSWRSASSFRGFVIQHLHSSCDYCLQMSVTSFYTNVHALKERKVKYGSTTHSATTPGRTHQCLSEPARLSTSAFRGIGFERLESVEQGMG